MVVVAVLTAIAIVFSSLQHKETQEKRFVKAIAESDSLLIKPLRLLDRSGDIQLADFKGSDLVVVFWATWSEKSNMLLDEITLLKDEHDNFNVVSAVVLDAEETINMGSLNKRFIHVDGASFYNDLKVPGIPSYIVIDENGNVLNAHVGYQENAGYSVLKSTLDGN